jgi:hypothetical protein
VPNLVRLSGIRAAFVSEVLDPSEQAWVQIAAGAPTSVTTKVLAEDTFLRFSVAWEHFVSEWFMGALSHDTHRFTVWHQQQMKDKIAATLQASPLGAYWGAPSNIPLQVPRYPGLTKARTLLDPGGANITFPSLQYFVTEANTKLAPRFGARAVQLINMGAADVIEPATKIRNALSHRSERSIAEMNARIRTIASFPALRKARVSRDGIGTYLTARVGGIPRLSIYKAQFSAIANALAP